MQDKLRLNLGCGKTDVRSDFVNVDIAGGENVVEAELLKYLLDLPDNTVDEIVLQDVLEHFPHGICERDDELVYAPASQTSLTVIECAHNKLKPGGEVYIRVPDLIYIMEMAISGEFNWDRVVWCLFGGQEDAYDFHHTGWTKYKLDEVLHDMGFENIKVERVAPNLVATATKPEEEE